MRIGIIGGGCAGLVTAWLLQGQHEVTLFERAPRLGGHGWTVDVALADGSSLPIDVGVEFFGDGASYPMLHRLLQFLDVPLRATSVGATIHGEDRRSIVFPPWGGQRLDWRAFTPAALADCVRFGRFLRKVARSDRAALRGMSLRRYLESLGLPERFLQQMILPLLQAHFGMKRALLWDGDADDLVQYCRIMAPDGLKPRPIFNIPGGVRRYVEALRKRLEGIRMRLGADIVRTERTAAGYAVRLGDGESWECDQLIIAAGPDAAPRLLPAGTPVDGLRAALAAMTLFDARIALHGDQGVMPRDRRRWSKFNIEDCEGESALTVWHRGAGRQSVFRSWAGHHARALEPLYGTFDFHHPLVNESYHRAQNLIRARQGEDGLWIAGAYAAGNDSHESAIASAVAVARRLAPASPDLARLAA
jgi:uncharacterized protein